MVGSRPLSPRVQFVGELEGGLPSPRAQPRRAQGRQRESRAVRSRPPRRACRPCRPAGRSDSEVPASPCILSRQTSSILGASRSLPVRGPQRPSRPRSRRYRRACGEDRAAPKLAPWRSSRGCRGRLSAQETPSPRAWAEWICPRQRRPWAPPFRHRAGCRRAPAVGAGATASAGP